MFRSKKDTVSITLQYCAITYENPLGWEDEPTAVSPASLWEDEPIEIDDEFERDLISLVPITRPFRRVRKIFDGDQIIMDLAPLAQYIDAWREDGTPFIQRNQRVKEAPSNAKS